MATKYKKKDGKLVVTNQVAEEIPMERLLQLRDHYEKDLSYFSAKLDEVNQLIMKAEELGIAINQEEEEEEEGEDDGE